LHRAEQIHNEPGGGYTSSERNCQAGLTRCTRGRGEETKNGRAEQDEEQSNDTNRERKGRAGHPYRGRRNPIPALRGLRCPAARWRESQSAAR